MSACDVGSGRSVVTPGAVIVNPALDPNIGNSIWVDDGDGIREPGEVGLAGVRVTVRDLGGTYFDEDRTDDNGLYQLRIPLGLVQAGTTDFIVTVDAPSGAVAAPCDQGSDDEVDSDCSPVLVVLGPKEMNDTIDFGFVFPVPTGSLGSRVWVDTDSDGIQGDGEPGLDFVDVRLRDSASRVIATVTTRGGGQYRFTGLEAGAYHVEVDLDTLPRILGSPAVQTFANVVTGDPFDSSFDSDASPALVVLSTDDARDPTIDFGFLTQFDGAVGDLVWHDLNADGLQDPGEPGLVGIVLILRDGSGSEVFRIVSGPGGRYRFVGLPPSRYTVEVDPSSLPPDFEETLCDVGADEALDSECGQAAFEIASRGAQVRDVDFGFRCAFAGTIEGRVWFDRDSDGVYGADDVGLEEIGVQLVDALGASTYRTASLTDGGYRITGLRDGVYRVRVDVESVPLQFTPLPCPPGQQACETRTVAVPTSDTVDFGYRSDQIERIGDRVFHDLDGDGLQDTLLVGPAAIAGVRVVSRDSLARIVGVRRSDQQGRYSVDALALGETYRVAFDPHSVPSELAPTLEDVGKDDARDSDHSPAFKTLLRGGRMDDVDFGFYEPLAPKCVVLDFARDDRDHPLANGQDISSAEEFGRLVLIDGLGPRNLGAAIFDSAFRGPNAGGSDPDLIVGLGNVLILQELGSVQTTPGFFDQPNDAGGGGTVRFDFTGDSEPRSLDLIGMGLGATPQTLTVTLTDRQQLTRTFHVPDGWAGTIEVDGPPGFRTLYFTTLGPQLGVERPGGPPPSSTSATEERGFDPLKVRRIDVEMTGSAGLDNLSFCHE